MRFRNLLVEELKGHANTVLVCAAAMCFAGYVSSYFEAASYTAANISSEALPGLVPSIILVVLALLPAIFVTLGMYALLDANEEVFSYEVGVYATQGIDGYMIVDTWSSLYGWIPSLGYVAGLVGFFVLNQGAFSALQAVLADIIAGLFLVAALPGFIMVPRKLGGILEKSPYTVARS